MRTTQIKRMGKRWICCVKAFSVLFSLSLNMAAIVFQWLKSTTGERNNQIRVNYNGQIGTSHHFGSLLLELCISLLSHRLFDVILEHFRQIIAINLHIFSNDNIPFVIRNWNRFHLNLNDNLRPILPYFAFIQFANENLFIHAFNDKWDNLTLITVTNWKIIN